METGPEAVEGKALAKAIGGEGAVMETWLEKTVCFMIPKGSTRDRRSRQFRRWRRRNHGFMPWAVQVSVWGVNLNKTPAPPAPEQMPEVSP